MITNVIRFQYCVWISPSSHFSFFFIFFIHFLRSYKGKITTFACNLGLHNLGSILIAQRPRATRLIFACKWASLVFRLICSLAANWVAWSHRRCNSKCASCNCNLNVPSTLLHCSDFKLDFVRLFKVPFFIVADSWSSTQRWTSRNASLTENRCRCFANTAAAMFE